MRLISGIPRQVSVGSCAEGSTAVSFSFSVVFHVTSELPRVSLISGSISAEVVLPWSVSHQWEAPPFSKLADFLPQILRSTARGPPEPQVVLAALTQACQE